MTIYGRSEELVSRCVECDLAEPESLASLGGSAPGVVDGILSIHTYVKCLESILTIPTTSYNKQVEENKQLINLKITIQ